jgi:hypothetical protein
VVSLRSLCPSKSWMVRKSAPASSRWVAKQWRLFRGRDSRHYAGFRTIPGEVDFELIGGVLTNIFPA